MTTNMIPFLRTAKLASHLCRLLFGQRTGVLNVFRLAAIAQLCYNCTVYSTDS